MVSTVFIASMKRVRESNLNEASDSSLEDHNDGILSTDTSATNQGAPVADGGGVSDQMRLEERRAYNRRNAARSRQRVKDQLRDLQQQVIAHTTSRSELERTNVRLLAENNVLRDEVHKLRTILSGAPLFGQQQQSLQPFLQQPFHVGLNGNAQFLTQGVSHQNPSRSFQSMIDSSAQPTSQNMLSNAATQQQIPFSFYSASTQNQMQQDPASSGQPFATPAGDGSNNQSAMVQLLLQQIMNNTSNNNPAAHQLPNTTATQEQSLQLQQQQMLQQPPQQSDNAFAAFMAFVGAGAGANASIPSNVEGKVLESQQQSSSIGSLLNDTQQPLSSTQSAYPLIQQQQMDQLNVQELQQSIFSQQQQPYMRKEEKITVNEACIQAQQSSGKDDHSCEDM